MMSSPQASESDPEMQDFMSLKDLATYLSTSLLSRQVVRMDEPIHKLPGHRENAFVTRYLKPAMVTDATSSEEDDATSKNSEDWTTLLTRGRDKTHQSSTPTKKSPESA
jgi:hypothetical protein